MRQCWQFLVSSGRACVHTFLGVMALQGPTGIERARACALVLLYSKELRTRHHLPRKRTVYRNRLYRAPPPPASAGRPPLTCVRTRSHSVTHSCGGIHACWCVPIIPNSIRASRHQLSCCSGCHTNTTSFVVVVIGTVSRNMSPVFLVGRSVCDTHTRTEIYTLQHTRVSSTASIPPLTPTLSSANVPKAFLSVRIARW